MFSSDVKQLNGSPSLSAHYSKLSNLFFGSWEDNVSLIGKLQVEREPEVTNSYRLNPGENKEKTAIFPLLGKSGNLFCNFEDICANESSFFAAAMIKKNINSLDPGLNNFGLGVVIKVTREAIHYQPIINIQNINAFKIEAFVPFDLEVKGNRVNYLLCMMEDGTLQVNQINLSGESSLAQEAVKEAPAIFVNNILTEINSIVSPQEVWENNTTKGGIVNEELLGARNKVYLADFMEKSSVLELSLFKCEDDMVNFAGIASHAPSKYGGQPAFAAISYQLNKNPLNVKIPHLIYFINPFISLV